MSEYILTNELVKLSNSTKWDLAKLEWQLVNIEKASSPETCLCGHFPIIEVCIMHNEKTGYEARIGNCCVKKFNDQPDKIFRSVSRVRKDKEKSLNSETLTFALQKGWIDTWSYNFYIDILRKRILSEKQLKKKVLINESVMRRVSEKK